MLQPADPNVGLGVLSTWGAPLITVVVVSGALALGLRLGQRVRASDRAGDSSLSSMIGATFGLVAFILAFTFGMAASRHEARRQLVLVDANAIGTAHLRASLLNAESAALAQAHLVDDLDLRITVALRPSEFAASLVRVEELHAKLWELGCSAAREQPTSVGVGLFLQALNEVFDVHAERIQVGGRDRLPATLWAALFLLIGLAMWMVGYQAGLLGVGMSWPTSILIVAFALVVMVISDLDRPQDGLLRVGQQPLLDLQESLSRAAR